MNNEELNKAVKEYVDARLDKDYEPYGEHRQKQLSKFNAYDLEEAIEYGAKWQKEQDERIYRDFFDARNQGDASFLDLLAYKEGHRDGMKERREQMMKEAVEGIVYQPCDHYFPQVCSGLPFGMEAKHGDKVKLIIIKED